MKDYQISEKIHPSPRDTKLSDFCILATSCIATNTTRGKEW